MSRVRTSVSRAVVGVALLATPEQVVSPPSVLALYDLDERAARFEMPGRLDEISGLALTTDGRLLAHGDERAVVHVIDPSTGEVQSRFSVGDPPVRGDFEGIAAVGERLFLTTSLGHLFEFREVADGGHAAYRITDLGLDGRCEVEGLDYDPVGDALLAACKTTAPPRSATVIHRIPLDAAVPRPGPLVVDHAGLEAHGLGRGFHASAVAVHPGTGHLLLAAARDEKLIEVDRQGRIVAGLRLSRRHHPQVEGLAFGPGGALYLADERNGREARLTVYLPVRTPPGR